MVKAIILWLIKFVISRISQLTKNDILIIIKLIQSAKKQYPHLSNADLFKEVEYIVKFKWPHLKDNIVNLIIELAVYYVKKQDGGNE
ncbi:MAG: hypothetical protein ACOYWZ_15010 [Bacillota bacterium]